MDVQKIFIGALIAFALANLIVLCIIAIPAAQQSTPSVSGLKAGLDRFSPGAAEPVRYSIDYAERASDSPGATRVQIATAGKIVTYRVEVAETPGQIRRGLMYRTTLASDAGMLFVFDCDEERHFWMKNTLIPLDMIYISGEGYVVGVRENAVPGCTVSIEPPGPCMYVLEVRGGQCRRQGICAGDPVTIGIT